MGQGDAVRYDQASCIEARLCLSDVSSVCIASVQPTHRYQVTPAMAEITRGVSSVSGEVSAIARISVVLGQAPTRGSIWLDPHLRFPENLNSDLVSAGLDVSSFGVTFDPPHLSFYATDWNIPQTVVINFTHWPTRRVPVALSSISSVGLISERTRNGPDDFAQDFGAATFLPVDASFEIQYAVEACDVVYSKAFQNLEWRRVALNLKDTWPPCGHGLGAKGETSTRMASPGTGECVDCPKAVSADGKRCVERICPKFMGHNDDESCRSCQSGTSAIWMGGSWQCGECPAGFYLKTEPGMLNVRNIHDVKVCRPCPVGEFTENPTQTACSKCPAGTYQRYSEVVLQILFFRGFVSVGIPCRKVRVLCMHMFHASASSLRNDCEQ